MLATRIVPPGLAAAAVVAPSVAVPPAPVPPPVAAVVPVSFASPQAVAMTPSVPRERPSAVRGGRTRAC
jgi:hypothetical protein